MLSSTKLKKAGSFEYISDLYDKYGAGVYTLALRLTNGHMEDATILVREVFFKVWEERHQIDGENAVGIQWFLDATKTLHNEAGASPQISQEMLGLAPSPDLSPEQIIQLLCIQGVSPRQIREQFQLDDQQWNTQLILAMRMIRDILSNA